MMAQITSIFLPRVDGNPYQEQLIDNLRKIGLKVEIQQPFSSSTFFFPMVIKHWKPDILHLHWVEPSCISTNGFLSLLKSVAFLIQLVILKIIGIKLVWTVHNLKNHDNLNLFLNNLCTKTVIKFADAIITHCEAAQEELIKTFDLKDKNKLFVVPHGNYVEWYENKISREAARAELNIKTAETVYLFLGLIRPYKGVPELIETFQKLKSENIRLVIAGKINSQDADLTELIQQKITDDQRINFIPGYIEPEKIQVYMNAADVVVFPYRDILTSGAVMLAMSFGKACIAPRKGCLGEVLDNQGAFLYNLSDENGLIHAMNQTLDQPKAILEMGQHNQQLAANYSWKNIAELTLEVYLSCL
ncbi:glycosyltransferase family 4 protein [Nostoc sp. CENA543]|uniref:glycosyltransferase family 4 protein n=1 Tax=Nostoc sp. CENA543 TaxID=1869241 RepID=UPI001CEF8412|nr:glycosyltransferase family 4 protein [Nostoc sp. CENA543]